MASPPVSPALDPALDPAQGFRRSEDALHEEAARIAGFDDFGDPSYLQGLRTLLEAYDQEARFNDYGRGAAMHTLLDTLVKRLRAEKQWRERPEVLAHDIRRPLVICGLVRTGSTALHYLLGRDPDRQCLEYWLAGQPQPRPPRAQWDAHPDFQAAKSEIDTMYEADPSLKAVHFMMPDGPEECRHLFMQEFTDDGFEVNASVPSYAQWYAQADMLPTYQRHRDLIKLIGANDTDRPWLLKYPVHMRNLAELLTVYPDACVVHTHRDPLAVFPSYVSLISGFRAIYEDDIDRPAIARQQLELWASSTENAIEERKRHDPAQFYDFHFGDFMAEPIATVKKMYAHFGFSLSEDGERRLRSWQEDNPQHKHGKHVYSSAADEIGVSGAEILERFADYMDHYGMEPERQP
jgi:hypothetical protein